MQFEQTWPKPARVLAVPELRGRRGPPEVPTLRNLLLLGAPSRVPAAPQTDVLSAPGVFSEGSCCWKRGQKSLAGRGRMPGFGWGCVGVGGSSLALRSVVSVHHFLSQRHQRHASPFPPPLPPAPPPSDFLALNTALSQEVAEILMCCQSRRSEAAFRTVSSYDCHAPRRWMTSLCSAERSRGDSAC